VNDPVAQRHGRGRNFLTAALVLIAIVAADQASKAWILTRIGPRGDSNEIKIIPGFLRFIYVENSGAAFGLFQGKSPILTILAMVVVAFLIVYFRHAIAGSLWLSIALGLQLGGALGNVIDRFRHGFVVDFVNVPKWWTFNVADSAITIGVIMLGLYLVTRDPGPEEEKTQSGAPVSEAPHAED
jgi:signal peptidase II